MRKWYITLHEVSNILCIGTKVSTEPHKVYVFCHFTTSHLLSNYFLGLHNPLSDLPANSAFSLVSLLSSDFKDINDGKRRFLKGISESSSSAGGSFSSLEDLHQNIKQINMI